MSNRVEIRETIEKLSKILKALSDPTRLEIILLLSLSELCVNDMVKEVGLSQPVISHHLRILCEAGLVEPVRKGRFKYFKLVSKDLISALKAIFKAAKGDENEIASCIYALEEATEGD
ncbi:MAG TPA: ArsR family transcriptional regulator [Thermofilum sp.]|nr:ArsR family transcriptional regulator [Thermofilum sp.]